MSQYSHLPYRPCVGMMLLNEANEVFVARRIDMRTEAWQMPQGGIDEGETPQQAVLRELKEEIGTDKADIIAEYDGWLDYDLPDHLVPQIWDGKYRGQTQKWFALRYRGRDADIDIHTSTPEFSEWKWAPMHELPQLIVPFKRALYEKLVAGFAHLAA
jgi:putative (di)nucleoside polyphosphate hydrolase